MSKESLIRAKKIGSCNNLISKALSVSPVGAYTCVGIIILQMNVYSPVFIDCISPLSEKIRRGNNYPCGVSKDLQHKKVSTF